MLVRIQRDVNHLFACDVIERFVFVENINYLLTSNSFSLKIFFALELHSKEAEVFFPDYFVCKCKINLYSAMKSEDSEALKCSLASNTSSIMIIHYLFGVAYIYEWPFCV
jgi:hypothetical protein